MNLHNVTYNIYPYSATMHVFDIYNARKANKLNKYLKEYVDKKSNPITIQPDEEARFFVKNTQLDQACAVLKIER